VRGKVHWGCYNATALYIEVDPQHSRFGCVCVFITAGPSTKLFAWGGGGYWRTCATRDVKPRPVWTSLPIKYLLQYLCVLLLEDLVQSCSRGGGEDGGGHVLRETTSRGLCGLVCPSRTGTREEPGTLFSLVPLVWESNPKLQGGWCKTQPPAHRGI